MVLRCTSCGKVVDPTKPPICPDCGSPMGLGPCVIGHPGVEGAPGQPPLEEEPDKG